MRCLPALVLLAVGLIGTACGSMPPPTTATDEPVFRWLRGELEAIVSGSIDRVGDATRGAFADLDVVAVDGDVYGHEGVLTGRLADGSRVRVRLHAADDASTRVAIRVGQIGDEAVARQILRHIDREVER